VATLGGSEGGLLLLRFDATLPSQANILEAYILLERAHDSDDDAPVALHVARVVDPWSGNTVSWAHQPRIADRGAPVTRALASSPGFVRLDVRDIVNHWRLRQGGDFGVAVVAEGDNARGMAFALLPAIPPPGLGIGDPLLASQTPAADGPEQAGPFADSAPTEPRIGASFPESPREPAGPKLELYVK
jgi:hypothetical protein